MKTDAATTPPIPQTSASSHTDPNIGLPAGAFFARNDRDPEDLDVGGGRARDRGAGGATRFAATRGRLGFGDDATGFVRPGTVTTVWHAAHLNRRPARSSGTSYDLLHCGQTAFKLINLRREFEGSGIVGMRAGLELPHQQRRRELRCVRQSSRGSPYRRHRSDGSLGPDSGG